MLTLMYITNIPEVALIAEKHGVDRVWVDLEALGKEDRQKNIDSVKSHHSIEDVRVLSSLLKTSQLLVRVNPWNADSVQEIEAVIENGADAVMLPMWRTVDEVKAFVRAINGRAKTILLLETCEAEACLDDVLLCPGIDEIHVGLNDLHLSYKMKFMFELLSNGTVDRICSKIEQAGLPYGFGGVAALGNGNLPAEYVIKEHYRIGSTRAILSRGFCNIDAYESMEDFDIAFGNNMKDLRLFEEEVMGLTDAEFEANRAKVLDIVEKVVKETTL